MDRGVPSDDNPDDQGPLPGTTKKRQQDMTREEKLQDQRERGARHREKKRKLKPPRQNIATARAEKVREKARASYHEKKKRDLKGTLQAGRDHQQRLRFKRGGGPVRMLVTRAIKNVLAPFRRVDKKKERIRADTLAAAERRASDPAYLALCRTRGRMASWLVSSHPEAYQGKMNGTRELVGCTRAFLLEHLQEQLPGFDASVHEMDHVFPLMLYDVRDASSQRRAMNWTNVQPLTKHENRNKSDKLPTKAMAAKVDRDKWPSGVTEDMLPDIYPGWTTPLRM